MKFPVVLKINRIFTVHTAFCIRSKHLFLYGLLYRCFEFRISSTSASKTPFILLISIFPPFGFYRIRKIIYQFYDIVATGNLLTYYTDIFFVSTACTSVKIVSICCVVVSFYLIFSYDMHLHHSHNFECQVFQTIPVNR